MAGAGAAIGGGLNALAGLVGYGLSYGDLEEADQDEARAAQALRGLNVPGLQQLLAQEAGASAQVGAPDDFGNRSARNAAIQLLLQQGQAGGNSLEDRRTQAQAQRAAGQATRQATQSALQSAASRGMGGAASTLQAQLLGASTGADRAAQVGLEGASNARMAALQALQSGGSMAGTAEAQDSARDLARRQAMDQMAQFNAQVRQRTNEYNSGLAQQHYQNQLGQADRNSQAALMDAERKRRRAGQTQKVVGSIGQALGGIGQVF